MIHSTHAAGDEPRLAHITNDFERVAYALVQAGARPAVAAMLAALTER